MRTRPSGEDKEVMAEPPAAPLASIATVSFVDVSPPMEMALKDRSTAWVRRGDKVPAGIGASVARIPRRVAMFGWIMPAPLVMPTREYVICGLEGRVNVQERSLGKVSVVQMARAAASHAAWAAEREEWAEGIAEIILEMGNRCPIHPVEINSVLCFAVCGTE